jgi:hypothetical protein
MHTVSRVKCCFSLFCGNGKCGNNKCLVNIIKYLLNFGFTQNKVILLAFFFSVLLHSLHIYIYIYILIHFSGIC